MNKPMDIIGKKFNRLTVLEFVCVDKYGNSKFLCKCDCGKTKILLGSKVKGDRTKSCGCLHSETAKKFAEKAIARFTKAKNAYKGASETVISHDKMMFHKGEERVMEKAIQFVGEICEEITGGKNE